MSTDSETPCPFSAGMKSGTIEKTQYLEFNDKAQTISKEKMIKNITKPSTDTAAFEPNRDLLSRIQEFMPKIKKDKNINALSSLGTMDIEILDNMSNEDGTSDDNEEILKEKNEENHTGQYVVMNVGVGVFDVLPEKKEDFITINKN